MINKVLPRADFAYATCKPNRGEGGAPTGGNIWLFLQVITQHWNYKLFLEAVRLKMIEAKKW